MKDRFETEELNRRRRTKQSNGQQRRWVGYPDGRLLVFREGGGSGGPEEGFGVRRPTWRNEQETSQA